MRVAVLLVALPVLGCGSTYSVASSSASDTSFPASSYAALSSDAGAYRIEVRTSPAQPPVRGVVSVQLLVSTSSGAPADGLVLEVVPWMPSHGHGTSVVPEISSAGAGIYRVDDVDLFMPGAWELRTTLGAEGGADHATISIDVQ